MPLKSNPCKECQGREVGCHQHCPDYNEWKTKRNQLKTEDRKRRGIYDDVLYGEEKP